MMAMEIAAGMKAHQAPATGASNTSAQFMMMPREIVLYGPSPSIEMEASDRIPDAVCDKRHDNIGSDVRQYLRDDNARRAVAGYFRDIYVIPVSRRGCLRTYGPGRPGPAGNANDNRRNKRARIDADRDQNEDDKGRYHDENVGDGGQQIINHASDIT